MEVYHHKYGLGSNGWRVPMVFRRASGFFRGLYFVSAAFEENIRYRVYSTSDVFVWHDKWVGESSLASRFALLFSFASNRDAFVKDYFENQCSQYRKELEDWMVDDWQLLTDLLNRVSVPRIGNGRRIWEPSIHGKFIVKSFCRKLMQ